MFMFSYDYECLWPISFLLCLSLDQHDDGGNGPLSTEDIGGSPPTGNRRLTRSMCATPQNDKNLPQATGTT